MRFPTSRPFSLLVLLLGLALVAPAGPARAATTTIGVSDFSFSKPSVTVSQGSTVTWQFHAMHTTTSRQGLWDSGQRSSGSFPVTFSDAGTFAYLCTMHPSMTGVVRVPLKATGKASTGYKVSWSVRTSTPSNRRYDAQYKRKGASKWTSWRKSTAQRSATFNPTHDGTYLVRSRTRNVGHGTSGWTSALSLKIT